jgi:membrane protein implicated in regulation of membrane protease activity
MSVRDWLAETRAMPIISFLSETLIPGLFVVWAGGVWSPFNLQRVIGGAPVYYSPTRALWVVLFLIWLGWYWFFKSVKNESQRKPLMQLRHALLDIRSTALTRAQEIHSVVKRIPGSCSKEEMVSTLEEALAFEETLKHILRNIFLIFSHGNLDLDKHVRVTLMEPEDDGLKIKYFANSENEVPKCMSMGKRFKKREGCAGWAWHYMRPFILSDIDKYRDLAVTGAREEGWFIDVHEHQKDIKSIVCIPIIVRNGEGEKLVGVLCIDTDVKRAFRETREGERYVRIRAFPSIRAIALLYEIKELVDKLKV